ncbi:MAG: hypothetical protein AAGE99_04905 [Chlamydiota bacterium]
MRLCQSFLVVFLLFFCSCDRYDLAVKRESVDRSKLASTYVGSPDPRRKNPPTGEKLVIRWRLPRDFSREKMTLVLDLVYKNHTRETLSYPISRHRGMTVCFLVENGDRETKEILTYKAEIRNEEGFVIRDWKHRLWTELIVID